MVTTRSGLCTDAPAAAPAPAPASLEQGELSAQWTGPIRFVGRVFTNSIMNAPIMSMAPNMEASACCLVKPFTYPMHAPQARRSNPGPLDRGVKSGSQMTGSTRLPASLTCQRGPPSAHRITTIDTGSVVVHANTDLLGAVTECS